MCACVCVCVCACVCVWGGFATDVQVLGWGTFERAAVVVCEEVWIGLRGGVNVKRLALRGEVNLRG